MAVVDRQDAHDARRRGSIGRIDLQDARMGVRRPDQDAVKLAVIGEVVDILALALEEPFVLKPAHRLADAEFLHVRTVPL